MCVWPVSWLINFPCLLFRDCFIRWFHFFFVSDIQLQKALLQNLARQPPSLIKETRKRPMMILPDQCIAVWRISRRRGVCWRRRACLKRYCGVQPVELHFQCIQFHPWLSMFIPFFRCRRTKFTRLALLVLATRAGCTCSVLNSAIFTVTIRRWLSAIFHAPNLACRSSTRRSRFFCCANPRTNQ